MSVSPHQAGFGLTRTRQDGDGQQFFSLPGEDPVPQILNGATLPNVNVPSEVVAGDSISITGTVGFDCPHCVAQRDIRVRMEASGREPQTTPTFKLTGRGETEQFSFDIPAPQEPGQAVSIRLKAQRSLPDVGVWYTDNTAGPFNVNVLSQQEMTEQQIRDFAPWAIGGGAAGLGVAQVTGRSAVGGGIAGAGGGVAAKVALDEVGSLQVPEFPTTAVIATAALLGAGAFLLAQTDADLPTPSLPSRSDLPSIRGRRRSARRVPSRVE